MALTTRDSLDGTAPASPPQSATQPHAPVATRRVALTGRARVFIAVGIVSVLAGLVLGVRDLQRVGVLLLVLPLPAYLTVRQARASLRIQHALSQARIRAGERAQVRLTLSNPSALGTGPLRITESIPGGRHVRFSVSGVRGRQKRAVGYPLPQLPRGRHAVGPTTVLAADPFGLVIAETRSVDTAELIVQPVTQALAPLTLPVAWRDGSTTLSHSVGVGGTDDASVREYRHGDDLRKIHWRSTARSGSLMVRQEERPWHGESLVLLDTRHHAFTDRQHDGTSAAFEWAVSAAASIGCHLIERNRSVSLVLGDGRLAGTDEGELLDLLADARPTFSGDLDPLLSALRGLGRESSVFAVFAAYDGNALAQLAARPRMPGSAVALLLRPWTWTSPTNDRGGNAVWVATDAKLRSAGWRVVAVDATDDLTQLWPQLLSSRAGR